MKVVLLLAILVVSAFASKDLDVQVPKNVDDELSLKTIDFVDSLKLYADPDSDSVDDTRIQAQANEYFDVLFEKLGSYMTDNGLDPMKLPDVKKGFEWKIIITYHGELEFTKGWLNDLYTIHRRGDAIIRYSNKLFNIKIPFGFKTLLFDYRYKAKFMNLGPDGGVNGRIEEIDMYMDLTIDITELEIVLQEFRINEAGSLKLKWTGNGLFDWLANIFTNVSLKFLHGIIISLLDTTTENQLEKLLEKINQDIQNIIGS